MYRFRKIVHKMLFMQLLLSRDRQQKHLAVLQNELVQEIDRAFGTSATAAGCSGQALHADDLRRDLVTRNHEYCNCQSRHFSIAITGPGYRDIVFAPRSYDANISCLREVTCPRPTYKLIYRLCYFGSGHKRK